jgi:hypothetical protein
MSGTFTVAIAGVNLLIGGSVNIPYNVAASTLQQALT